MEQFSDNCDLKLLREEFSKFAKRVEELEKRDQILARENEELKTRIKVLEATTERQQDEIDCLKNTQEELIGRKIMDKEQFERSKMNTTDSPVDGTRASSQGDNLRRIKKGSEELTVAFFSTLSHALVSPGHGQQIIFDNVITNVGNKYNVYSGDFRAPIPGIYVFSTTILTGNVETGSYMFKLNGKPIAGVYVVNSSGTIQVVLDLNFGDTVAVHVDAPRVTIAGHSYTTFSGFLLNQRIDHPTIVGK
ncbi:biological adhesion [Mactra antiquata]